MLFYLKFLQINGRILRRNLHFIETKCHAEKMCFPGMAFFMVLILILQQKNDSPDLPFYFTLSFFCCFRNANSLLEKRSTAGCFCLIKPKKTRIFGFFSKRKHCTIVSFVQCGYGGGDAYSGKITYLQPFKMGKVRNCVDFLCFLLNRFNWVTMLMGFT